MQINYSKENSQGVVIETIGDGNVLFQGEYDKAKNAIKDIISQQGNAENDRNSKDIVLVNNRIIFIGQRGSGKTSALLSLKQDLSENGIDVPNYQNGRSEKVLFYCLPTVDPSYFDGNNNILTTVLSLMFSNAKHTMEKYEKTGLQKRNEYEILLQNFSKVYKAIGQIELSGKNPSYTIEKLNEVSNASNIHSLMDDLLDSFNNFLKDKKNKFLLVIDDLDMNVAYAADMMEQLRKFLSLKNLIILMSANIDQLHYEMCEHYSKAFVNTMNDKDQARFIEVEDMATKYLLKLFPTSRRINVEHPISQLLNADLAFPEIDEKGEETFKTKGKIQPIVLSLIWERTRLLFVPEKNELHPIIPTNLRELMQFIDVLEDMPKLSSEGNKLFEKDIDYTTCKSNLSKFKEYFLKTWVPSNLSVEAENVFYTIPEKVDEINKHLINAINVIGTNNKQRLMSREVDLDIIEKNAEGVSIDRDIYTMVSPNDPRFVKANKISDIFNQPSNYSYGDLLLMLDKYETYFESERDRRFSNAIKIYYTILLFETMFFSSNNVNYKKPDGKNNDERITNLKNRVSDIIPIQRLIGGTIYYPNYFEIITSKYFKQKGPSYDAKRAFYHKVKEDETDDMPLFSVLYYGDIRPDRYDTRHVYDTTFEHDAVVDNEKYKTFDMLSIMNNMLNPWQTIARAYGSEPNKENWAKEISKWVRDYCQLGSQRTIGFPNAILPFYSVDMMLNYIRESYDVQEIIDINNYDDEEMASNWLGLIGYENNRIALDNVIEFMNEHRINFSYNGEKKEGEAEYNYFTFTDFLKHTGILKTDLSLDIEKIKAINRTLLEKLLEYKVVEKKDKKYTIDEEKLNNSGKELMEILKEVDLIKEQDGEYIINLKKVDTTNPQVKEFFGRLISIRVVMKGDEIIIYNHCDKKLYDGIKILTETRKYYNKLTNKKEESLSERNLTVDDGLKCFRDFAIAKIMSLYSGGHREQAILIKNLYRYNSITEMYRYLFDVLWKDAIIEYCIRQEIQKTVHSREFVELYYLKLHNLTIESIKEAFGSEEPYKSIYSSIFACAKEAFID